MSQTAAFNITTKQLETSKALLKVLPNAYANVERLDIDYAIKQSLLDLLKAMRDFIEVVKDTEEDKVKQYNYQRG